MWSHSLPVKKQNQRQKQIKSLFHLCVGYAESTHFSHRKIQTFSTQVFQQHILSEKDNAKKTVSIYYYLMSIITVCSVL